LTPILQLDAVERRYARAAERIDAVRGVSLDIAPGETLGLVGASGSGKSTLARLAMALETPDAGRVLLDGTDLAGVGERRLRAMRRRWSMVFQDPTAAFNPRATVEGAIATPLRLHRVVPKRERREAVSALLASVGLDMGLAPRRVHSLSGGQQQRVALARALSTRPALVVLDEAISALDTATAAHILRLLVDIQRRERVSFLFISHNLAAVSAIAHRVAVIDAGLIVELGPTRSVIETPSSAAARALIDAVPSLDVAAPLGSVEHGAAKG
jgi:peptide/nickel transport system ATP-binding protein